MVICNFCKQSFNIKQWNDHRKKCEKNPHVNVECKYCKKEFNQSKIEKHKIKCKSKYEKNFGNVPIMKCKYCNKNFQDKYLSSHECYCMRNPKNFKNLETLDTTNQEHKSELIVQKNDKPIKNSKNFVICEHCEEKIEENKIKLHHRFNHMYKELKFKPYIEDNKTYKGNNVYIVNDDGSVEFLGEQEKTSSKSNKNKNFLKTNDSYYNYSAKDNMAFSIRDNGKFGSIPLYDSLDDE